MFGSRSRSALLSATIHAAAILMIVLATGVQNPLTNPRRPAYLIPARETYLPISPHPSAGGGGGQRSNTPASLGRVPRAALRVFTAPNQRPLNPDPPITFEPTILASLDTTFPQINLAQFGDPRGVLGPYSGGPGSDGGIGNGKGGGNGDNEGPGGPGFSKGPAGGGGNGPVIAPVLVYKTEPEYSEDARRAKLQGTVVLRIDIDIRGVPQNIVVHQGLGLGLDERAIETVRRWRFKPAYRNGKAVPSTATIEVTFRLL